MLGEAQRQLEQHSVDGEHDAFKDAMTELLHECPKAMRQPKEPLGQKLFCVSVGLVFLADG